MRSLLGLFARSPFAPLAQHTERVLETVRQLRPLFEAFFAADAAKAREVYQRISSLEHSADELKNEIRDNLPRSLFLPVDRGDILLFLKEQDAMADRAEDVGVLLTMRKTEAPEALRSITLDFVNHIIECAETWNRTAQELPALQEASFTGPEVAKALEMVRSVAMLEHEADLKQAEVSRALFDHEDEIGAVSVVFWMNILTRVGSVANHAENTADLLRLMLARR